MWTSKLFHVLVLGMMLALGTGYATASEEHITIAAASDLKFAMAEIVASFAEANPSSQLDVVYGSSGKFRTQIEQGAPYDLYFSADISYPRALAAKGLAGSEVVAYALGRLVLWSRSLDATKMTLADLVDPGIRHIAIANPRHAPYGMRATEALQASGLWDQVAAKLVFGENIAHAAQLVQTENAEVGLIALSLAVNPVLSEQGGYWLIPDDLHQPLEQGYIITRHGADNALARRFTAYMHSAAARGMMIRYGFVLPGEAPNSN